MPIDLSDLFGASGGPVSSPQPTTTPPSPPPDLSNPSVQTAPKINMDDLFTTPHSGPVNPPVKPESSPEPAASNESESTDLTGGFDSVAKVASKPVQVGSQLLKRYVQMQKDLDAHVDAYTKNNASQRAGEQQYSEWLYKNHPHEYGEAAPLNFLMHKINEWIDLGVSQMMQAASRPDLHPEAAKAIQDHITPYVQTLAHITKDAYLGGWLPNEDPNIGRTESANVEANIPNIPVDIEELPKAERAILSAKNHPLMKELADKYGAKLLPTSSPSHFITPDGKFIPLGNVEHEAAVRSVDLKGTFAKPKGVDPRIDIINNTGAVRARFRQSRAGDELAISIPKDGPTSEELDAIKADVAHMGRYGNLVLETADDPSKIKSLTKEFATPKDVDEMLTSMKLHPSQTKKPSVPEDLHPKSHISPNKVIASDVPDLTASSMDEANQKLPQPSDWTRKAETMARTGGFTIDPRTGEIPKSGHLVEVVPERRAILSHTATAEDIKDFAAKNKDLLDKYPELQIGGYGNELNLSASSSKTGAQLVAKRLDQQAIWDVKEGKEINTGGTGTTTKFPQYSIEGRMADLKAGKSVSGYIDIKPKHLPPIAIE